MNHLKKTLSYFFRDELSIRHKFVNVILGSALLVQVPGIVVSIVVGTDLIGLIIQVVMAVFIGSVLYLTNRFPESRVPPVLIATGANLIGFPIMFFVCGGSGTGIVIWMLFGAIFTWLLLDIKWSVIISVIIFCILTGCLHIEKVYPQYVSFLETRNDEIMDTSIAFMFVTVIFGLIFKYQTYSYEKQAKILRESDEELRKLNEELAEANTRLESASAAKSSFLANMSHEIRTPINAVLGMDEMILRECKDDQILEYANDIDSAGHQLLSLVNDILDFSKIESGMMELHPVEYELFSIMNDCYNMIYMRAKRKELEFTVENDPDIPAFLYGDEVRIRQIIMNLLTNAVKYTKDGSVRLIFSYEKTDDRNIRLIVSVKDTGIGISEENRKYLFDSFKRIDEKSNRNIEGTGLGLSITRKFTEMMGGEITVESVLYEGSTFTVAIPQLIADKGTVGNFGERLSHKREKSVEDSGKDKSAKKDRFTAPRARVLVVDDVKMNLNVVRLLLKNTGMQIDLASSGDECLKYTLVKRYDVILMDHMMPIMDGIETLHKLREQADGLNADTPVVALTANALVGAQEMYLEEGFVSYISKPVKSVDLEAALVKLLPKDKVEYGPSDPHEVKESQDSHDN
ncbi:MAG: response regulator [Lachnospiraceae bacterium]|nr:response regulator [Lachnospiraceae bacterium]